MSRYKRVSGNGEIVEVEAVMLTHHNAAELAEWCMGHQVLEIDPFDSGNTYKGINIKTPNGTQRVSEGQYIIQYDTGEFYVVAGDIFHQRYEAV